MIFFNKFVLLNIIIMNQRFRIARIYESRDMSIGNRRTDGEYALVENIENGSVFNFFDHNELKVISIDEKEMVFTFKDVTYRLNREWQVLGTPSYHIPNQYISESERFVFYFSIDDSDDINWDSECQEIIDLYDKMKTNRDEGNIWKNIPLAQRFLHILKDLSPERDDEINPALRAWFIEIILKCDFISVLETPRLYQSYCEYYRLCLHYKCESDYNDELRRDMDKYYFRTVDGYIEKLSWIVRGKMGDYGLNCWNSLGGTLKVDPIQASEEWEDVIYDVEKEVDEQLKDELRGMGFCHIYWSTKRAALAKRGVEWKSPNAMNPRVIFD